jgi:hypothetical protein
MHLLAQLHRPVVAFVAAFGLLLNLAHAQPGPGGPPPGNDLVKQFDRDGDKRLNAAERKAAREFLAEEQAAGRGPRRPGPRGGRGGDQTPPEPGIRLTPAEVKNFGTEALYDPAVVRTLFFEFEGQDWEKELAAFYRTDVEVPAKLTVDGRTYPDVGMGFRGASSFFTVSEGRKRSFSLSLDFVHDDQNLGGYRTLNLLNSHTDPSYLRTVLFLHVAGHYIPAPKANHVRVVINGENWGIYVNAQQVNKELIQEHFGTTKGSRWKTPGSPRGQASLAYRGDDPAAYREAYDLKTKDTPEAWAALIKLCQTLEQTPADQLETALAPILDVDGALKFLALDNALINNDGYWVRTSDYYLYLDERGRFHLIPHDANETFRLPGGPGGGRFNGVELDPFYGDDDPNKPLLSKLLAVPALRQRYAGHVKDIAENWLDWNKLGPIAEARQALIADDVKRDTRKLDSTEAFENSLTGGAGGSRGGIGLKEFADQRRAYLLGHPEIQKLTAK